MRFVLIVAVHDLWESIFSVFFSMTVLCRVVRPNLLLSAMVFLPCHEDRGGWYNWFLGPCFPILIYESIWYPSVQIDFCWGNRCLFLSMTAILDGWSEYNEVANSKWFLLEYPLRNQTPPWGLPGSQRTCVTLENETREVQGWLSVPYKKGLEVEAREISQNGNRFVSIANNVCSMNHYEQHHTHHGTLRPASGKSKSDPGVGAQVANKQHGHELSGDRGKSAGWSVL